MFMYKCPLNDIVIVCIIDRNLQAAVGFYLDYYSGMKLPSMQIISDVTIGEGEAITPNTP